MNTWNDIINPTNLGAVLQLAILEGLLSFDNALALAALVSGRLKNHEDRKHALLWGIWGAYIIRTGVVFVGVWLMEQEWIKLAAGLYLLWIAFNELFLKKEPEDQKTFNAQHAAGDVGSFVPPRDGWRAVWSTILAVELMDIMFSVDSVAVALAVSNTRWVLIAGAVIGILMMRVAASYFIRLIEKFPILVKTAFVLVGIAGLKVVLEVRDVHVSNLVIPMPGIHVPEGVLLPIMFMILIGSMAYNARFPERFKAQD